MKKKVLALILSSVMVLSLAGCGNDNAQSSTNDAATEDTPTEAADDTADTEPEDAADTETETDTDAAPAATDDVALKIAIVSSPSGVDDGSFNEDNYNGILTFIDSHPGCTVTPVQETTGDVTAAVQAVADVVADYDVIVCCGFQFAGIATIAEENPDVKFVLVDSFPSDAEGNEVTVDNIYAMQFAEQEDRKSVV